MALVIYMLCQVTDGGVSLIPIPAPFATLQSFYPMRPLTGDLKAFMASLGPGNTPCCVQVSHALNMAGERLPETYGGRRSNTRITVDGVSNFYILAVDELEQWLTQKYGAGINVRALAGLPKTPSSDANQQRKDMRQMQAYLGGYQGILVFRAGFAGLHTELWDSRQILQRDMDEPHLFSQPRILFWYCI